MFRPLFRRSVPFPLVLGCSLPLVGVDAKIPGTISQYARLPFHHSGDEGMVSEGCAKTSHVTLSTNGTDQSQNRS